MGPDAEHVESCLILEDAHINGVADSPRAGVTWEHVGEREDAELDLGALRSGALHAFDVRQPIGT